MNCPIHKYEPICYINIGQKNFINQEAGYDSSFNRDQDDSQTSEENEDVKDIFLKDDDEQSYLNTQQNRFLCAECNLTNDIDKKYLLPLRKLVFNQERLYNNWPPLDQDLNQKVYDILKCSNDQQNCMIQIDIICSNLIEQFTQQVNSLKKDLMRIEGEKYQILADLQMMYNDISNIDTFRGLLTQQQQQQQQQQANTQSQQATLEQTSPCNSTTKEAQSFDIDHPLLNFDNLLTDLSSHLQGQQLQVQNGLINKQNSQNSQQQDAEESQKNEEKQGIKNSNTAVKQAQQIDNIKKKIDDFLEEKYAEKRTNSLKITKLVQQLNKFKPLEENLKGIKDFGKKMQSKLKTLQNQIKFKLNLTDFQIIKSQFKNSSMLHIDRNYKNQITIHTNGQIWGQVYSDFILDNHLTYQFVFQFKQQVQNFIIIGLIPDAQKDSTSQGSSQNHFGKIFGQENITYCGTSVKGKSTLSFLKKNETIMMEVCVAKNHLTFSDYPNQNNITKLHSEYNLYPNGRYRLCIEFYDFDEENTITLIDAKCY
ncbi:hypothetical protein ABPG74_005028 [Tetrahymena malaccensis]